ncbi:hypothetical protein AOXY_G6025 [Acipenser oxyrinchus oxyrinchus]|uniref:Uncharacterized protein n=1 Tax=Acipenser oxyrinchus oxyrinchus TaxID=40147 RepID=A0AAD8LQR5_ACIOX|nr:hypothetical protein AOXY_G6025 [Acipenser oxyrinchus oxyrinchus]
MQNTVSFFNKADLQSDCYCHLAMQRSDLVSLQMTSLEVSSFKLVPVYSKRDIQGVLKLEPVTFFGAVQS